MTTHQPSTSVPGKGTIYSVQYLRGIAAFVVLLAHVAVKSDEVGRGLFDIFHFGATGVDIFFVISGFIMCHIYFSSRTGPLAILDFWSRRVIRILPLYWLLSLVALVVFLIAPGSVNSSGGTTSIWRSFLLFPSHDKFLIQNGWTLSYEMYFYAAFSIAFLFRNKFKGAILVSSLLALISIADVSGLMRIFFFTNPIISEFAAGIVAGVIFRRYHPLCGSGCILVALLGAVGLLVFPDTQALLPGMRWLTAGVPAALFVGGLINGGWFTNQNPFRLLETLGDSSYSMYLFHPFSLAAAGLVFSKLHLMRMGPTFEVGYWFSVVFATLIASYYVFLLVERPLFRSAMRKFSQTRAGTFAQMKEEADRA